MANRSSVVRSLLGEGNILSSSNLESSVRGEFELSLGVESVEKNDSLLKFFFLCNVEDFYSPPIKMHFCASINMFQSLLPLLK